MIFVRPVVIPIATLLFLLALSLLAAPQRSKAPHPFTRTQVTSACTSSISFRAPSSKEAHAFFLERFQHSGESLFNGWMSADSLAVIASVSRAQRDVLGVVGSVGEIGVHHGRSFVALALSADLGREKLWACDVFERQDLNEDSSGLGDRGLFASNLAAVGISLVDDVTVFDESSLTIPEGFLADACLARFRFFSVDGGHTHSITLSDLHVAAGALAPGGVVALDDVLNPGWPGVKSALDALLAEKPEPRLVVFATNHKAFLCAPSDHARLLSVTRNAFVAAGLDRLLELDNVLHGARWPALRIKTPWDEPIATFEAMIREAWDMPEHTS